MQLHNPEGNLIQRRPTESGAVLLGAVLGILVATEIIPNDPAIVGALTAGVGVFAPFVTWLVNKLPH